MIMKMIQNLENKMESQVNSLETRIEKMQEGFNKDLEEIKKSQYIMNNAMLLLLNRSPVPGILQARVLECVAISFSRRPSQPRDRTLVFHIGGRCFNL